MDVINNLYFGILVVLQVFWSKCNTFLLLIIYIWVFWLCYRYFGLNVTPSWFGTHSITSKFSLYIFIPWSSTYLNYHFSLTLANFLPSIVILLELFLKSLIYIINKKLGKIHELCINFDKCLGGFNKGISIRIGFYLE